MRQKLIEQQTGISEVLRPIASSPHDLETMDLTIAPPVELDPVRHFHSYPRVPALDLPTLAREETRNR
jgi:hypothetical protein